MESVPDDIKVITAAGYDVKHSTGKINGECTRIHPGHHYRGVRHILQERKLKTLLDVIKAITAEGNDVFVRKCKWRVESVSDDIKVITAAVYDIFYRKGEWRVYQTTSRSSLPQFTTYSTGKVRGKCTRRHQDHHRHGVRHILQKK